MNPSVFGIVGPGAFWGSYLRSYLTMHFLPSRVARAAVPIASIVVPFGGYLIGS